MMWQPGRCARSPAWKEGTPGAASAFKQGLTLPRSGLGLSGLGWCGGRTPGPRGLSACMGAATGHDKSQTGPLEVTRPLTLGDSRLLAQKSRKDLDCTGHSRCLSCASKAVCFLFC